MLEEAPGEAPTTTCFHHTDRPTGRRCTRCGRYACPSCLRDAAVGAQCWQCIKDAAPPRTEQARRRLAAEPLLAAKTLIVANVAIYALMVAQGAPFMGASFFPLTDPRTEWVLFGPLVAQSDEWWRIVTSGFIHFGVFHIGFNMLILYQVALVLERVVGSIRFALIYFLSLLAGSLGVLLLDPDEFTAGASGAVFGVAAAATLLLYRRGVPFWSTGYGPLLVINLLFTFTVPGISVGGHIGGMLGGIVAGAFLMRPAPTPSRRTAMYATSAALGLALFVACIWAAGQGPRLDPGQLSLL